MVRDKDDPNIAYIDFTGRFAYRSSTGNQYLLEAYHYNGNCILARTIKDRKATTTRNIWSSIHKLFEIGSVVPNTYIMDNVISSEFINTLTKGDITF